MFANVARSERRCCDEVEVTGSNVRNKITLARIVHNNSIGFCHKSLGGLSTVNVNIEQLGNISGRTHRSDASPLLNRPVDYKLDDYTMEGLLGTFVLFHCLANKLTNTFRGLIRLWATPKVLRLRTATNMRTAHLCEVFT